MKNLRTPLSQVKGLGSAREGTNHFWLQRVSALALVPLILWFCFSLAILPGMDQTALRTWLASPFNAVMMILVIIAGFYHGRLGLQVVIEDYIGPHAQKTAAIILVTLLAVILGVTGVFSILRIAFTGA